MTATLERAGAVVELECSAIVPALDQNREHFDPAELQGLAESIRERGLLQPVTVRYRDGVPMLVAGERRLRACRDILGLETVRALVVDRDDAAAALDTLDENLNRADVSPTEEARGYRRVLDAYGWPVAELARKLGQRPDRIRRRLGLLDLADETRHYLETGQLPVGRAELMVGLDTNRQHLALEAQHRGLGLDAYRALVERLRDEQSADSMFDAGDFLRVDEYIADAVEETAVPVPDVEREAVLGPAEIAERLEVRRATVHQWRQRALLPEPDLTVSGTPVWYAGTIDAWAHETGRAR